jgi:tRNA(adenine34) deaminase
MEEAARALGRWRLSGCTVYVTLEPCLMCAGLMVNARVDRCVYGAPDPKGGALGTLFDVSHDPRLNHAFEVTSGVLADEAADQLRAFFRARRKSKG